MRRNPEGRKVVHLRLGKLMPANRTPVRIKIVTRMFRTLESGRQVQIFSLTNDDLAMIVGAGAQRDVNNIIHRIRKLFEGDPLTFDDEGGNDHFISWYDLTLDAAMAIHAAQQLRQEAQTVQPAVATSLPNITPAALDEIHKKLAFLNVVPFVRNQVALRIDRATNEASIEFFEFFLSVADIQRQVAPTWNLFGDRSLFQDLSRTMDLRMLDVVARAPDFRGAPAVSLNLNLETVFTPGFGTFLERLEQGRTRRLRPCLARAGHRDPVDRRHGAAARKPRRRGQAGCRRNRLPGNHGWPRQDAAPEDPRCTSRPSRH